MDRNIVFEEVIGQRRMTSFFNRKTIYLLMRFFSKFVFICNLCFGVMVISSFFKISTNEKVGSIAPLSFIHGSAVVLGILSLLFNTFFCFIALMLIRTQKMRQVPLWIIIANFIFLLAEIYWFFLSKGK